MPALPPEDAALIRPSGVFRSVKKHEQREDAATALLLVLAGLVAVPVVWFLFFRG